MKRYFSYTALALVVFLGGCTALQEIANLRNVDFAIENVIDPRVAGVDVQQVHQNGQISFRDVYAVTSAINRGELPFSFTLNILAENPEDNPVNARMVRLNWSLFLDDEETIQGVFTDNIVLEPGQPQTFPIEMELDLLQFFERDAEQLLNLALAVSGQRGSPTNIHLEATPIIDTPVGSIEYPRPVRIDVINADNR